MISVNCSGLNGFQRNSFMPARIASTTMSASRVSVMAVVARVSLCCATTGPAVDATPATADVSQIQGYEFLHELGRGGMGVVYLAIQQSTRRKVAGKVLLDGRLASEGARRRFEREVELAAGLDHRHIVTILESGISSGRYYFAMQYIEGRRLDEFFKSKALPPREVLRAFAEVCDAVNYAHQRSVLRRRRTPSTSLVAPDGKPHLPASAQ